jgi:uracil-DNA glycosylase
LSRRPAFDRLQSEIISCRRCVRLVDWRERVAREKRASFRSETYWGRPVPSFGDPDGRILVVGLAPAAHGANRTGRMFTGDRSGDWLYRALYRAGFASQAESTHTGDGLTLTDVLITAAVHCAPPANKPTPGERDNCSRWLHAELDLLTRLRVLVVLGGFSYAQTIRVLTERGVTVPKPRPRFGHGVEVALSGASMLSDNLESSGGLTVLCSYHPSQQNTFTGTLTEQMFDSVWARARALAGA